MNYLILYGKFFKRQIAVFTNSHNTIFMSKRITQYGILS